MAFRRYMLNLYHGVQSKEGKVKRMFVLSGSTHKVHYTSCTIHCTRYTVLTTTMHYPHYTLIRCGLRGPLVRPVSC
jgi:hypothetical protein